MRLETDLAEEILVRLPVKTLVRFKLVSKEWKRMIESDQYFKERQMIQRQSQEPAFLVIEDQDDDELLIADHQKLITSTFLLSSLMVNQDLHLGPDQFTFEISFDDVSRGCVDGLICISSFHGSILVFNPSTRWMREVPHARLQTQVLVGRYGKYEPELLGFGKDIRTRTYKLVWLYNSSELGLEGATTCEVFDFNINTWRYVESSPHRIVAEQGPIYVDGSLHWFIYMNDYIQILSFDCNTEMFQVMSESPITTSQGEDDGSEIVMCNLNNRLCVSERKWLSRQDIWTLNGTNNMTWEKMYSLDLSTCPAGLLVRHEMWPLIATPVEVLRNKKLLLFDEYGDNPSLLVYDLEARAFSLCLDAKSLISVLPYFESLISI